MKNTNQKTRKWNMLLAMLVCASLMMTGCDVNSSETTDEDASTETASDTATDTMTASLGDDSATVSSLSTLSYSEELTCDVSSLFTDRDLSSDYEVTTTIALNSDSAEISGEGAQAEGSVITITAEGVYEISGTLSDGQIIVNADGAKVQLVLNNAEISCTDGSAILIESAKKTFITLAAGSSNTISDGTNYPENPDSDAAIYSHDTLTINGSGALTVNGNYADGIVSKDELVITGGDITVNAVGHGIKGKDYVAISNGTFTITSGEDGIKSSNTTDGGMGFVYIENGTFTINAEGDGIQAETELIILGGAFDITCGGGTANAEAKTGDSMMMGGGGFGGMTMKQGGSRSTANDSDESGDTSENSDMQTLEIPDSDFSGQMPEDFDGQIPENFDRQMPDNFDGDFSFDDTDTSDTSSEESSTSPKGIKAGTTLYIAGGTFSMDTCDDALHSNGNLYIVGGEFDIAAGDKGIHADEKAEVFDGLVTVSQSYEGIEAKDIVISGGTVHVTASDDGFNASDGSSQGAMGSAVDATVTITGGYVYVNASGDGLDSNGSLEISGGVVLVDGPVSDGDAAIDANSSIEINGGYVIAVGSSGMAEYPDSCTQNTLIVAFDTTQSAGTMLTICDADGNEICSYAPSKNYSLAIISSDTLESGQTYTVYTGGSSSESETDGLYQTGGYQNDGTETGSVTIEDSISSIGSTRSTGMSGGGMMGGGRGGMMGGDFEIPTDENGDIDDSKLKELIEKFEQNGGDIEIPTDENGDIDKEQIKEFIEDFEQSKNGKHSDKNITIDSTSDKEINQA